MIIPIYFEIQVLKLKDEDNRLTFLLIGVYNLICQCKEVFRNSLKSTKHLIHFSVVFFPIFCRKTIILITIFTVLIISSRMGSSISKSYRWMVLAKHLHAFEIYHKKESILKIVQKPRT